MGEILTIRPYKLQKIFAWAQEKEKTDSWTFQNYKISPAALKIDETWLKDLQNDSRTSNKKEEK